MNTCRSVWRLRVNLVTPRGELSRFYEWKFVKGYLAVLMAVAASCGRETMLQKRARTDGEYLKALSNGKNCVPSRRPVVRRVGDVSAETACVVAAAAMREILNGKGAASGMLVSYASKISEIEVSEISSKIDEPGLEGFGFWDAYLVPSPQKFPFLVRFDRDTREISLGFCGECVPLEIPAVRDTASRKKRGVAR